MRMVPLTVIVQGLYNLVSITYSLKYIVKSCACHVTVM